MNIGIRLEQPMDYHEAEIVTREAFWNCYSPGCMEHYLLHIMRDSPHFVRKLDFVAVSDAKIVGLIVFMEASIWGDDGNRYEVLSLGPIAVSPPFQHKGVGRLLIEYALTEARKQGYRAILLCGDPQYYRKVGFMAAEDFGIRTSENKYVAALQICPLYEGALQGLAGRYIEDDIYIVNEAEAEAFDKQFPPREFLKDTPTQLRFQELLALQKDYIVLSKNDMSAQFHIIDKSVWERSIYFDYYYSQIKCKYNINANIDITHLVVEQKKRGIRFFPVMLYVVMKAVNQNREFRMSFNENGELGYWDEVVPSYTLFHPDTKTFTDIWSEYSADFETFYRTVVKDMATYRDVTGVIKARPGQPANFCPVSSLPWLSFTAFAQDTYSENSLLFPLIKFGKYFEKDRQVQIPVSVFVSHAVADGYHTCKLINDMQEIARQF